MRREDNQTERVLLKENFVFMHKADQSHYMPHAHFHNGYEIHFTLTNDTTYQIDETRVVTNAGSIALFNSEELHRVSVHPDKLYERYVILFKAPFFESVSDELPNLLAIFNNHRVPCQQLNTQQQQKALNLFYELAEQSARQDDEYYEWKLRVKLLEILFFINDVFHKNTIKTEVIVNADSQFTRMIHYLKRNYDQSIDLDKLCQRFFTSKATINRSFKQNLGMTPMQYLIHIRVMNSRKFLAQGLSIKVVAEKVGYQTESSFIKKFKEVQGLTPKQYILQKGKIRGTEYVNNH